MAQKVKISLLVVAIFVLGGIAYFGWLLRSQGNAHDYWKAKDSEHVLFDAFGVPTIKSDTWTNLIKLQGHVVASERLWQMDLIRHKAGGRLSEWFGKLAFPYDKKTQLEDRIAVATKAAELMPPHQKQTCDQYARGVNDFIEANQGHWGIEYLLLGVTPEPWTCRDSLLVLIEMSDLLTSSAENEAKTEPWRKNLSQAWNQFLYTQNHPWNKPLFGKSKFDHAPLPPRDEYLPMKPLSLEKQASVKFEDPTIVGSNNWAWSGETGRFLANDPHLGQSVPQIWYANRLVLAKDHWVAGVSLPGIPGVIIGMNAHVAWAFTNTGEDVDDFLQEKISEDGSQYLARVDGGKEVWQPIIRKTFSIKIKGEAQPMEVEGLFTHRGPLSERKHLGDGLYSRQWLALHPEVLRIPVEGLFDAGNLDELSAAISEMKIPAQNIVAMDHQGNIRYRTSGTGIKRRMTGVRPVNALDGEWLGFEPQTSRRELTLTYDGKKPIMMATANERIWVDDFGQSWYNDDRKERIMSVLASSDRQSIASMEHLHHDTTSRFRKLLLDWIVTRAEKDPETAGKIPSRWKTWDGSSLTDSVTFEQVGHAERELSQILLQRVADTFVQESDKQEEYFGFMRRAWLLTILQMPGSDGTQVFGVDDIELAKHLVSYMSSLQVQPHEVVNHWAAQHPFVTNVPVIGRIFAVSEFNQFGDGDLVMAEKPTFGPSMRMVWDLEHPENSTWVFPVGQSGHVWSKDFRGFRKMWEQSKTTAVFPQDQREAFGL